MLRLLADENFNNNIIHGLLERNAQIDIVRVQDSDRMGADDPTILEWAAQEGRLLLTHDKSTMTKYAYERVRAGLAMPGVVEIRRGLPIGRVIEDLLLLVECSLLGEHEGHIRYLPL